MAYLERSTRQLAADQAFLRAERKEHAVKKPVIPPATSNAEGIALNKPADWYGRAGARRIADIIVSFQTPAGGWSKNLDMTRFARVPGGSFAPDNRSRWLNQCGLRHAARHQLELRRHVRQRRHHHRNCDSWRRSSPPPAPTTPRIARPSSAALITSWPRNIQTAAGRRSGRFKAVTTTPLLTMTMPCCTFLNCCGTRRSDKMNLPSCPPESAPGPRQV